MTLSLQPVDALGLAAALCMLLAFACSNIIVLRLVSMSASVFFILYALAAGLLPILLLHGVLFPLNAIRLVKCMRRGASAPGDPGLKYGSQGERLCRTAGAGSIRS
jgi:hypothetical protein